MNLCDAGELQTLLARHGFHFSKSMGQNFLIDPQIPASIAASSQADSSCGVLEIGPGAGCLTVELARRAGKVVSVELDAALLPILAEAAPYPNVEILPADVMNLDLESLVREKFPGLTPIVCANLPYNITTPVLTKLLEADRFQSITVMIQREVARRICALPGDPDCGAFSLFCQYHVQCQLLFEVPSECFLPAPKVTSAVVRLTPHAVPPVDGDRGAIFAVVKAAFAQRRKTLLNALSAAYGSRFSKDQLRQIILDCGLPETVRGERLGLDDFSRLARRLR